MLKSSGRRVDLSSPFVDAVLPDGSRLHVVIPDITREHWYVNVRKFVVKADSMDDLVRLGTLTRQAARFLEAAVASGPERAGRRGTQAGKTTLLNCLAAAVPPRERIVTCEEVFELRIPHRDVASMQCRQPSLEGTGEIPLRRLVKEALRMRPSRIVVGEVRQAESLDLLIALNSGLPGMCTIHANSAREAVTKMCTLPLLAGENVSARFVVPTVAASIDLVVHAALERDGRRTVREIAAVPGRVEGDVVEIADLFVRRGGELVRADGFPPHRRPLRAGRLRPVGAARPGGRMTGSASRAAARRRGCSSSGGAAGCPPARAGAARPPRRPARPAGRRDRPGRVRGAVGAHAARRLRRRVRARARPGPGARWACCRSPCASR